MKQACGIFALLIAGVACWENALDSIRVWQLIVIGSALLFASAIQRKTEDSE